MPVTKRFGAIIMEQAPTPSSAAILGPAGELTTETEPEQAGGSGKGLVQAAPPGPGEEVMLPPLVAIKRTQEEIAYIKEQIERSYGKEWDKRFHQQIDELYKQVATEFSSPPANAEKALSLLREARQTVMENPAEYISAEYRVMQVRTMIARTRESRKQSAYYGPRLFGYELGWMAVCLIGLIFAAPVATWLSTLGKMSQEVIGDLFPIWSTMMWGGIGGVIGALYHLWWHISEKQDFDRHYFMWYLVQPVMGLVLGGIVFLLLGGGFLMLQVDLTSEKVGTAARLLPYLTSVLAGFRQNFIYEQFDRLIALFTTPTRSGGGEGRG